MLRLTIFERPPLKPFWIVLMCTWMENPDVRVKIFRWDVYVGVSMCVCLLIQVPISNVVTNINVFLTFVGFNNMSPVNNLFTSMEVCYLVIRRHFFLYLLQTLKVLYDNNKKMFFRFIFSNRYHDWKHIFSSFFYMCIDE